MAEVKKEVRRGDRDSIESALKILSRLRRRVSRLDYFGIIPQESYVGVMGHILDIEKELSNK